MKSRFATIHYLCFISIFLVLSCQIAFSTETLPNDITKIALVIGSPKEAIESSFGHAFLRFSNKKDFDLSDWTIEFTANTPEDDISYLRGMGIGPSYKLNVHLSSYSQTSTGYTQAMDRDLTQYELNLTPEQIRDFTNAINDRLIHSEEDTYNFLFNNCTTIISKIIEDTTKLKISGYSKNVPVWIPNKLKEMNLIKKETVILGNTSLRNKIIDKNFDNTFEKYLNDESNFQEYYLLYNLKVQLKSYNFQDRLIAYLKLVHLVAKQKIDKEVLNFAKRLINSEIPRMKLNLLNIVNFKMEATYAFYPIEFSDMLPLEDKDEKAPNDSRSSHQLSIVKDGDQKKVIASITTIEPKLDAKSRPATIYRNYDFELKKIVIDEDFKNITLENKLVDLLDNKFNIIGINKKNYMFYPDFIKIHGKKYLLPIFLMDNLASWSHTQTPDKWRQDNLNLLNKGTSQSAFGNCYALAILQKQLMENAYFEPAEEKRIPSYYENLMNEALRGEKVVVPGVRSIKELSNIITEEKVQQIVSALNARVSKFSNLAAKWFQRDKIDPAMLEKIKHHIAHGIYPILTFVPYPAVKAEHALLVYSIEDKNDYYLFHVYDPNFGIIPKISPMQFKLDKKTLEISSTVYPKAKPESARINFEW